MVKLMLSEFSKLTARKGVLLAVILSLFVPVVYGGISLSAKWSPMDHLDQLPVAVVNNDRGAIQEEEPLHVGNQLVETLQNQDGLGWEFVDTSTAMKGLQSNEYYMVVVIPEDFSARAITVMDEEPQKLELEYIQNEGLNYLAGSITNAAMETIREQLADTITKTYVTTVFDSLDEIAEGFQEAAEGSELLADGSEQLHDGTDELHSSVAGKTSDIQRLADGAGELKAGTSQIRSALSSGQSDIYRLAQGSYDLYAGTRQLRDGSTQVLNGLREAEPGSRKLRDGLAQLAPGSKQIADGTVAVQDGARQLYEGVQKLADGVKQYQQTEVFLAGGLLRSQFSQIVDGTDQVLAGLRQLATESVALRDGAKELSDGLHQAYDGSKDLSAGLKQLVDGQGELVAGARELEAGARQIAEGNREVYGGWQELTAGASQLDDGMGQVREGTSQVNEGWRELADGATQLHDGAGQLKDGSQELAEGLKGGAEKTAGLNTGEANAEMFATPVQLASAKVNEYEFYRDSTAPYIMTLALFAGILIMSLFIKFKRPEDISSIKWFLAKYMKFGTLAIAQAILLMLVVLVGLKLSVDSLLGFILFSFIVALTFAAIIMLLTAALGNVGRFLALAFVIMQLGITGADLPREMLPLNLQNLSGLLPFTYSIEGYKGVILLDDVGYAFANMKTLLTYLAIAAVLAIIALAFNKKQIETSEEPPVAF